MLPNPIPLDITQQQPGGHCQSRQTPWPLTDNVRPVSRTHSAPLAALQWPLHHPMVVPAPLHHADWGQDYKMSTNHPAEGLQRPHGGCPPVVCFWDFPPPGVTVAREVHFVPPLTEEPRWEMFPLVS